MKKFKLLLIIILLTSQSILVLNGCKDENFGTDISGTYNLELNTPLNLPIGKNLASLTFIEFKDDRCPANVNCVRSGPVLAKIKFLDGNFEQIEELCLGPCFAVVKSIKFKGVIYNLILKDALQLPAPPNTITPTVTIEVLKAN